MPKGRPPAWDDDEDHGRPELCIHWPGEHGRARVERWIGHPDRLRIMEEDGRWHLLDLWTGERQKLSPGRLIVVERGGRAVVI